MDFPDPDAEQEELQRRSDTYEPNIEGPLVSEKDSIANLLTEYQGADELFITKLSALSRDHSTYRRIKRDGKCGWTAGVFGYFESLLSHNAGAAKIQVEMARFRAFNSIIESCGYSIDVVDFAMDATFSFMQNLHDHLLHGSANESHLLQEFNGDDQFTSNSIIYHFKLMTSAFMQTNPGMYTAIVDVPLDQYCRNSIEPQIQEIDYPGLLALAQGVIGPGGINFDVLYLDRSSGDEVTTHHFSEGNPANPLIEVLYRPGHYDLIYKDTAPIQINFHPRIPEYSHAFSTPSYFSNLETVSMINPDMSLAAYPGTMAPYSSGSTYPNQWQYMPSPFINNNNSSNASTPPTEISALSEEGAIPPQYQAQPPPPIKPRINDPIRFNPYTYRTETELPLTTPVFKNSPFNPNHFRNSSFHPQEYHPDEQGPKHKARRSSSTRSPSAANTGARPRSVVLAGKRDSVKKLK